MTRALGSFETALTLTGQRAPFVVVVVLRLESGPAPETLREALDHAQRRHPLLDVHIVTRRGRFHFERNTPPIPLRVLGREGDGAWHAVAEHELNDPVDVARGPLLRACHLWPGDTKAPAEIVLTFHHSVMDAASGGALLRQLLGPTPDAGLPAERTTPLLPPLELLLPRRFQGAAGAWRRAAFLLRQLADELAYRTRTRGRRHAPARSARSRILCVDLEPAATAALVQAARRRRVTLNAALGAAFLLAVGRLLYGGRAGPMRHISFADLRPQLRPEPALHDLACFITMMRETVDVDPRRGFWPLAQALTQRAGRSARRGDKFAAATLAEPLMRHLFRNGRERMAHTAVSYMGPLRFDTRAGAPRVRGMHAFVSNLWLGPEYTALARIFDGRLQLDVLYLDGDLDAARAGEMATLVLALLRDASHPGGEE